MLAQPPGWGESEYPLASRDIDPGTVSAQPEDLGGNTGTCNANLPNDSGYHRFLYTVQKMVDEGFYVLIDNHLSLDNTATTNSTLWIDYYENLLTGLIGMGTKYQNAIMVDILNEPDAAGLT